MGIFAPSLDSPSQLTLSHSNASLALGGQTYYFGFPYDLTPNLSATNRVFQIPFDATIDSAYIGAFTGATVPAGQVEPAVIWLHDFTGTTDSLLTNQLYYGTTANRIVGLNIINLNLPVSSTKEYAIKIEAPTFTTSPSVRHYVCLYFRKRN